MIIKKVTLKNFKVHVDREFNFEKGINIILGQNGAGKSSIFEAIGIAFFGATNGKELQTFLSKMGESQAKDFSVTVEFVGNDGIEYVVERRYSKHTLRKKNGALIADKPREVTKYIGKILGIDNQNAEELFKNVICAYQNDIVNTFYDNDNSKKFFNKIFEAEIYDKMYTVFRDIQREYEIKYDGITDKEKFLVNELSKYEDLEDKITQKEQQITELENQIAQQEQRLSQIKAEKQKIEENIEKLEKLNRQKELLEKDISSYTLQLNKVKEQILIAQEAREKMIQSSQGYEKYLQAQEALRIVRNKSTELEKLEREKQELEKKKIQITNEMEKIQVSITEIEKASEITKEQIMAKNKELETYQSDFEKKRAEQLKILHQKGHIEQKSQEFQTAYNTYLQTKAQIERINKELSNYTELEKELEDLKSQVTESEEKLREIEEIIALENSLIVEKSTIENEIKNLKESLTKLSDGTCPILKEKCLNISQKGGLGKFIASQQSQIDNKERSLEIVIQELSKIEKAKKEKFELERQIKEKREEYIRLDQKKSELEEKKKQLQTLTNQINEIQKEYKDIETHKNTLEKEIKEIITLESKLRTEIENLKNLINNTQKEIDKLTKQFSESDKTKSMLNQRFENYKIQLEELTKRLEAYMPLEDEIQKNKKEIETLEQEMRNNQEAHNQYISNKKIAESIDKLNQEREQLEKSIQQKNVELEQTKIKINSYPEYDGLKSEKEKIQQQLDFENQLLNKINSELEVLKKELEYLNNYRKEKEEKLKQIEELKHEKQTLELKRNLTEEFRNKLKMMGSQITKQLTQIIVQQATQIYQSISGKDEKIQIEIENGKYIFKLYDPIKGTREFKTLSGGEQVSVAIALRVAIAKTLTDVDLYILDEPTINLDEERRNLLAENLKYLLGNLSQAFVITHDEEFKGKGYNEIRL